MCGIVGVIGSGSVREDAERALNKISYRGIDDRGVYEADSVCFMHCLHSVVGNAVQPIEEGDFVFGANCEIYNWKSLAKEFNLDAKNDADLLCKLMMHLFSDKAPAQTDIDRLFGLLDGVFAFFLHNKKVGYTIVARDVLGEKPVWFSHQGKQLLFASERKAIVSPTIEPEELNPRKVIFFDHKTHTVHMMNQEFFFIDQDHQKVFDLSTAKKRIQGLLDAALMKRIPEKSLGLLFSGGIDSAILAFLLKKKGMAFTAYMTVSVSREEEAEKAQRIADAMGFPLNLVKVDKGMVKGALPKVMELIESSDPVKVEVGTTIYFSLQEAQKDNCKVIFSGVGADDIFVGYKRMFMYHGVNEDSLSNLRRIYERDLYRDDVLAMAHNLELRLPYLDRDLVELMLSIPSEHKRTETPKALLREAAEELGFPKEFLDLKRHAAQYSSGIGKLVAQIAKDARDFKGSMLRTIGGDRNIPIAILFSSGKDSTYAMDIQQRLNYPVKCLVTIQSENKESFMFHTPTIELASYQAEALGVPIIIHKTKGDKEMELDDLKIALQEAKRRFGVQGVVSGALYSNYQRSRIERICDDLNLKVYSPLWHMNQETEMRNLLTKGYHVVVTKVAAEGLDKTWLGRPLTSEDVDKLVALKDKVGLNVAGEGGEFESLVLDAPMFKKRLELVRTEILEEGEHCAELLVKEVRLVDR